MKKIILAIAALILITIIFYIGYSIGKNHVIYSQEIYSDNSGYIAVIDDNAHSYN